MRHPISVQPPSTYQTSNHQLWIFIIFIRRHIGAYHGPYLIFHPVTITCNITCASFEVCCLRRVVVLRGFLGCARDKRNNSSRRPSWRALVFGRRYLYRSEVALKLPLRLRNPSTT